MKQNVTLSFPDEDFTSLLSARALSCPAQWPASGAQWPQAGWVMVSLPPPERSFLNLYFRTSCISTTIMMVRNLIKTRALAPQKLLDHAEGSIKTVISLVWRYQFYMSSTGPPYTFQDFCSSLMALLKFQDLSSSSLAWIPSPLSLPKFTYLKKTGCS